MSRALSFSVFILLLVWTIDALVLQAEMAVLHSTPLPNLAVKTIFGILLLVGGFAHYISGRMCGLPRRILLLWFAFVIFLMIQSMLLVLRFSSPVDYVLFSFNAYYFAILVLPVYSYFRGTLGEPLITGILVVFFVPLSLLGIAQNFSSNVLLPTDSPNGYLHVFSWDFYGSVRAFSLFTSPSYLGHFIALMAGLGVAYYLEGKTNRRMPIALVLLALMSGYSTMTRASELEIACVMFTVWLVYQRREHRRLLSGLPIIYGMLGIVVAFVLPAWLQRFSEDVSLLSNWSIYERYSEWLKYGAIWIGNGLPTFLFGAGIAQNDRFLPGEDVLLDNSYLGIAVHVGVIGLILWLGITWCLWKYMLTESRRQLSPVRAAAMGAWSVWLFTSVFNISLFFPLPFLIFLMARIRNKKRERIGSLVGDRSTLPHEPARPLAGAGALGSVMTSE